MEIHIYIYIYHVLYDPRLAPRGRGRRQGFSGGNHLSNTTSIIIHVFNVLQQLLCLMNISFNNHTITHTT